MAATVGQKNPFRYRGYYFDAESGMYYLQSRYYDPEIRRFISADDVNVLDEELENLMQYNLTIYCMNDPINRCGANGDWSLPNWAKKAAAAVGVVVVVAAVAAVTVATAGTGTAAAVGALKGASIGIASGAAIGATTAAVSHRMSTGSWTGAGTAALNGMGDGALAGAVTWAVSGGISAGVKYGTFSSKTLLTQHFEKHGSEFGSMYTNAKDYARGAKYVIKNGTYIPEKNAYIRFLGSQGKANYAFVGMKAGGRVSTYHVRSVSKMVKDGVSIFSL